MNNESTTAKCRYIQGARLFGDSDANTILAAASISSNQPTPELAITNDSSNSTDLMATSLRSRFVGQGYKQVIKMKYIQIKVYECELLSRVKT